MLVARMARLSMRTAAIMLDGAKEDAEAGDETKQVLRNNRIVLAKFVAELMRKLDGTVGPGPERQRETG